MPVIHAVATRALPAAALALIAMSSTLGASGSRLQIDHILLGIGDLDQGVRDFEKATGVRPVYGGKHPGGTHNALVSLGDGLYLELIANQPGAGATSDFAALDDLRRLTPVAWAVSTSDIGAARAELAAAGLAAGEARAGSRITPSGSTLSWNAFALRDAVPEAPFFLAWSPESPHPSKTSPSGCALVEWRVVAPRAEPLSRLRTLLKTPFELEGEGESRFRLELQCPAGRVAFDSRADRPRSGE
jgi:hypothetical protein